MANHGSYVLHPLQRGAYCWSIVHINNQLIISSHFLANKQQQYEIWVSCFEAIVYIYIYIIWHNMTTKVWLATCGMRTRRENKLGHSDLRRCWVTPKHRQRRTASLWTPRSQGRRWFAPWTLELVGSAGEDQPLMITIGDELLLNWVIINWWSNNGW